MAFLLALCKENGSQHSVCTLSHRYYSSIYDLADTSSICMHMCHVHMMYVWVNCVLCVQLYSTKPQVVIDNHFVSFSHP